MNGIGIDNPSSTIENIDLNVKISNKNVQSEEKSIENETKKSPLMFISLTLHSLGIIFGDM
jgi:hypothetical protein